MTIRPAQESDLHAVSALERTVEDRRLAASYEVLRDRLLLHPDGFLVATDNGRIIGYLESIRWDGPQFERFDQIKDYEHMHRAEGRVLYLAFMAVDPAYRRRGAATQLLRAAEKMASTHNIQKLQLVALPHLLEFYRNRGFRYIRTLPDFLPATAGELMEKDVAPAQ